MFGAIGLTLFGADFAYSGTHYFIQVYTQNCLTFIAQSAGWRLLADIALIGLFGGFYIVPLYAFIQTHAEKSRQSRVIAANNILNVMFMLVSAGFSILLLKQGFSIPQLFMATAALNALVTIYLCIRQSEYLTSFIKWIKKLV